MKVLFLGTGAAEAIPSMFCRCDYCNYAREHGGYDVRMRTSLMLGNKYMFDFSPDANFQHLRENIDYYDLEHLMITHSHDDHLAYMEVMVKQCAIEKNGIPIKIYMSRPAAEWMRRVISQYGYDENYGKKKQELYEIIGLDYFQTLDIGEFKAHTVKGSHHAYGKDEFSLNYILENTDGKKLLYATDTGYYLDETWEHLKGHKLDKLIMECTFGGRNRGKHVFGHLDVFNFLDMLDKMTGIGLIDDNTDIYTTHINHKHNMLHHHLVEFFEKSKYEVNVSYDGQSFEF